MLWHYQTKSTTQQIKIFNMCSTKLLDSIYFWLRLGRISDEKLTNPCEYLNTLEEYTEIMVDKGIFFQVEEVKYKWKSWCKKTTKIANLRILVEKVIPRLKCFRILANDMAINQLEHVDDIL